MPDAQSKSSSSMSSTSALFIGKDDDDHSGARPQEHGFHSGRKRKLSGVAGYFQKKVFDLLDGISGGTLKLKDPSGTYTFGDGQQPSVEVKIHDLKFYRRLALGGSLAAAETHLDEQWDCEDTYNLFRIFCKNRPLMSALDGKMTRWTRPFRQWASKAMANTLKGSRKNIAAHYDLGNDFFELFLDPTLTYSSAWFQRPEMSLEEASTAKLERMCQMVELEKGDSLLEIGSGWGSLAIHAASTRGCRVRTITLSREQREKVIERVRARGLEDLITVDLVDYRQVEGTYDKLISIEMIEAVGPQFYSIYFETLAKKLRPGGLAAIQAITIPDMAYDDHLKDLDFIQKYIFPGSKIPCLSALLDAAKPEPLVLTDVHDLTLDYDRTMRHWRRDFIAKLDQIRTMGYDERFIRMWDYYLNYCAAGFAERFLGTLQLQFRRL
jgi:cyclopropane-fatty-acyl-phospholipid synthase